ncbi:hypothetical protein [Novosphingobium pentaromativorans]|uniref:Uncharacterized protein n=1 Tax=Novosphingobium pentaromativorans US6-1 TaxID=1088721 RepID=G6E7E2_9SPHN|nr:hypothetical protein [Novosphingobium pentaromativorans]AIT81651.1 hypothetical protein JI59_18735 [Novosphingobium pentaromativorans US6-1]EHJ62765.1 hypothetical protein NSU_0277 [Novosphingobium pentaromativorans US6-1]
MMRGTAKERIPYGALVLCRGFEVVLAGPEIANGRARRPPRWAGRSDEAYHAGDWVSVEPIEGLGDRDLNALANGPIMDPRRIYLPAGKLTERAYQERLDLQFREAGISRGGNGT